MVVLVPAELLWLAWAALVALAAALCVLGSEWTAIVTKDFVSMDSVATETTFAIAPRALEAALATLALAPLY